MSNSHAYSVMNMSTKGIRVLLVEDNQADVYLMKFFFDSLGFPGTIHHVSDGIEAVRFLDRVGKYENAETPDVVLLDLGLPKLNGHEVLAHVRNNPQTKQIPILILSTSKTESDSARAIELGANGFLTKPGDLDEIEGLVRHLVNEEFPRLLP